MNSISQTAAPRLQILKPALLVDAVATFATGLLLWLGAPLLQSWLQIPAGLMVYAGLPLLPFALFVGWLGLHATPSAIAVKLVIAINIAWVVASVVVAFGGWIAPNGWGLAFILAQAAAVGLFAEAQIIGLRQKRD